MRRLLLSLMIVIAFTILSASSANAQQFPTHICANTPIPAGWILVNSLNNPFLCNPPISPFVDNVWVIERYDDKARDARMNVCSPIKSGPAPPGGLPNGWAVETLLHDPLRCGRPSSSGIQNIAIIKCLNCPIPPPTPGPTVPPPPDLEGFFETADCNEMKGWVWNRTVPNTPLRIDILINDTVFAQILADIFRQDLVNAGKGDGRHGFRFELPARLKNNRFNNVRIRVTGTNFTVNPTRIFNCSNPIDNTEFFVRQQYRDFLAREADPGGLSFWMGNITQCGSDGACIEHMRTQVSKAFFLSIEFQETGYFLTRFYKAAFNRMPTLAEFSNDKNLISQGVVVGVGNWHAQLESNKSAYTGTFATRPTFAAIYNPLLNSEFVDRLFQNAGITDSNFRNDLVNQLNNGQISRVTALRRVVDDQGFRDREFNPAFVMMQYFGYLRRHPSDPPDGPGMDGFFFWLNKLNSQGDQNEMVRAFLTSIEYRSRFGSDIPFPASGEGVAAHLLSPAQPTPPCGDEDGDGYCNENDCDPFDPLVYPGAPIGCWYGQDKNCNSIDDYWECYGGGGWDPLALLLCSL